MNAKEMTERAGQKTGELQGSVQDVKEKAKDLGRKAKNKARTTAQDAAAAADLYIHEYTWPTFALVAVSAAVIGFLLGQRWR